MPLTPSNSHGPLLEVRRRLTSAELAGLGAAPITLIAAQGAGTVIVPVSCFAAYEPGTIPFANVTDLTTRLGGPNVSNLGTFLTSGLVATQSIVPGSPQTNQDYLNLALTLNADSASQAGWAGTITAATVNAPGDSYAPGDTGTIDGGSADATYSVTTVSNSFVITAVNQGLKTFTVTGDASAFAPTDSLVVYGSTGNDATYTIVSAVFGAGSTVITVVEAIPSAVADGRAGDTNLAAVGGVTAFTVTAPGTAYGTGTHPTTRTTGVGADFAVSVDTVTHDSNGTALVVVLYTVVSL